MEGDRFVSRPVTVLVLTPSIGGFYFGELLAGLGREVTGSGGRLVLVQTLDHGTRNNEASEPSDFATRVAWAEADGVVSITSAAGGPYLQQFRDAGKPVVLVSTRLLDFEAPVALPDNHGGTFAAVEHLIEHGHTRIGFVGNLGQADVRDPARPTWTRWPRTASPRIQGCCSRHPTTTGRAASRQATT